MDCTPILEAIARRVPRDENTYPGADGLLCCTACHGRRQVALELPGHGRRVVPCLCRCMSAQRDRELERLREQERHERIGRLRSLGFADRALAESTFDRDDRKNPKISDALLRYAERFGELRREGRGLLLYGPVGTGKTFYAACLVNALIDRGQPCLMTSLPRLINRVGGAAWEERQDLIDSLARYALVALDDVGTERQTDYTAEQMTAILDTLYRASVPLVITTNLSPSQLTGVPDIRLRRLWDRLLERCHPIAVLGESRRRAAGREHYSRTRDILGI